MSNEMVSLQSIDTVEQKYDTIQHLVDLVNVSDISSIKSIVTAIIRVINDPRSTVKELKEVILLDPPLAAKVLKTANSAYYSRSFTRSFNDIEQAIIWMGTEVIKELALSQKVCEIFDKDEQIEEYSRKALWRHSIAVALMAKMIYRKEFGLRGETAYVAGLLHDIGIIAEDQFSQEDFKRVLQLSKTKHICMAASEMETLGYNHAEVGEAITDSWRLPRELVATIGFHANPLDYEGRFLKIVLTLYIADYVCQENGFAFGAAPVRDKPVFKECLKQLDIKPYALELILKSMKLEMAKMQDKGLI